MLTIFSWAPKLGKLVFDLVKENVVDFPSFPSFLASNKPKENIPPWRRFKKW